jgi:hypothetical protein
MLGFRGRLASRTARRIVPADTRSRLTTAASTILDEVRMVRTSL